MKQYQKIFVLLCISGGATYSQKRDFTTLTAEQRSRYVAILKKLNAKVAQDLAQNLAALTDNPEQAAQKNHQERYVRSATLKDAYDRHATSTYTVRVTARPRVLFSDGRYKPAIETLLSGIVAKKTAPRDDSHAKLRHHTTVQQTSKHEGHDEIDDMIQHLIQVGHHAQAVGHPVIRLDDCTECELLKPQKELDYRTVACRRTIASRYLTGLPQHVGSDTVIFEPGIKNYIPQKLAAFDYKERLAELLQQHAADLAGLLRKLSHIGQENHAWNFYFMEKNITGDIITQIAQHYGAYAPEYIAAQFDLPAGLVWAQERVAQDTHAARKLAKIFLHKTSESAPDVKTLKNIIAIIHQVCDKDLVSQGLMRAITAKNMPLANMLIQNGADVNFISSSSALLDATPLEHAVTLRHPEIADLLVSKGATISTQAVATVLARELALGLVESSRASRRLPEELRIEEKNFHLLEILVRAGLRDTAGDIHNAMILCKTKHMSAASKEYHQKIIAQLAA